ncbi:hypothetical protein JCM10212_005096 [Sporobolomyces blumeae]
MPSAKFASGAILILDSILRHSPHVIDLSEFSLMTELERAGGPERRKRLADAIIKAITRLRHDEDERLYSALHRFWTWISLERGVEIRSPSRPNL